MKRENMMVNYVAPKVRVVEFKVESGFAGSPTSDDNSQGLLPLTAFFSETNSAGTQQVSDGGLVSGFNQNDSRHF